MLSLVTFTRTVKSESRVTWHWTDDERKNAGMNAKDSLRRKQSDTDPLNTYHAELINESTEGRETEAVFHRLDLEASSQQFASVWSILADNICSVSKCTLTIVHYLICVTDAPNGLDHLKVNL